MGMKRGILGHGLGPQQGLGKGSVLLVSGVASLCEGLRKVPVNGDCEIPLERSCSEKRSETAKLVSGDPAPPGRGCRSFSSGLYIVTAAGVDKSSIGQQPLSNTAACSSSERNF